jgi:hypothetical protein
MRRFVLAVLLVASTCTLRAQSFSLLIGDADAPTGDTVCLPVQVLGFDDIVSYNWCVNWDATVLEFVTVVPSPVSPNLQAAYNLLTPARLVMAWEEPSSLGFTLPDSSLLFELCFRVVGAQGAGTLVEINGEGLPVPVQLNATTLGGQNLWPAVGVPAGFVLVGTIATTEAPIAIARTWPNPTHDVLFFEIEKMHWQQVEVFDALGRRVATPRRADAASGLDVSVCRAGWHTLVLRDAEGRVATGRFLKQ